MIFEEEVMEARRKRTRSGELSVPLVKKKRVGLPRKFLFYEAGSWVDFPVNISASLRGAFSAGDDFARFVLGSCLYFVSFVQMLQVNLETGHRRSIAWVDDDSGRFRSPAAPFEGGPEEKLIAATSTSSAWSARQGSATDKGEVVDECFMSCGNKLKKLDAANSAYQTIREVFLDGMGVFAAAAEVTGVFEVNYESAASRARKDAFETRMKLTEQARGSANVQQAWYGCSRDELCRIIQHGFGRPTADSSYGVGVYLTPERFSRLSCTGADCDDKGEQHILFCRVILGRSEATQAGSVQFHPSSEQFDTGVDNLTDPKRFVVWSTHMNTHILPLYVTSFKLPKEWHEILEAKSRCVSIPEKPKPAKASPGATPKLFSVLKPELSATDMSLLRLHYMELKDGKLSREDFVKRVRSVAGDQKLRKIQEQIVGNSILCGLLPGKLLQMPIVT